MSDRPQSAALFERARRVIPGGVNSPVRAFGAVGGAPPFIARGAGARLWDADGNEYIDYVGSWGPLVLGHAHPEVARAVAEAAARGLSFGAPTEAEILIAERVRALMPAVEMLRLVNSGTEAVMSAARLARAHTKRDKIVKFEGCYHGHADGLLAGAGSGALTLGVPNSPGVPAATAADTLVADFNDAELARRLFARHGDHIACVIVEPLAGNMNFVRAAPEFLQTLRELCDAHGALLIFDEVMTGFRVAAGGAQALLGMRPDLTTLGKVVGGGLPIGAFGGRRDIMEQLAPSGPVYQAGTLSGNPAAVAAGLKTLELIAQPGFFERLGATARRLCDGLAAAAERCGVPLYCDCEGGMFGVFFTADAPVRTFAQATAADADAFKNFHRKMLAAGHYFAPSPFEAGFVSAAHADADIDATVAAAERAWSGE